MLCQQVLHRAQYIRPMLAFLRALLCLKKRQLMAQVGDAPIKRGCARRGGRLGGLVVHSVRADPILTHPADPILTRGWTPAA